MASGSYPPGRWKLKRSNPSTVNGHSMSRHTPSRLEALPAVYRLPLCPYLVIGNRRMLIHLDAYGVPQSLQWPAAGAPDRLAWRDPIDEWPYWEELAPEKIRDRMPYFEYADGTRDYLHEAECPATAYIQDTNMLEGRYALPGGAVVETLSFVTPDRDVWVRRFRVRGVGKLVFQGEFFEKAVRGHALAYLGHVPFRGAFMAPPRGVYIITSTLVLTASQGRVETPVDGEIDGIICLCAAEDLIGAVRLGEEALARGLDRMQADAAAADRAWLDRAKQPVAQHPFVQQNYKRWLLSHRLQLTHDGAMVCGPRPSWSFVWPRDGSQLSVAFAMAGYIEEAQQSIAWQFDRTPESGVHDARYHSDGQPMRLDNRPRQGDNPGFLCWAAGAVCREHWDPDWALAVRDNLYRMADHLVQSRDDETLLPLPEADHRETQIAESIGIAVTAIGGLKGAAFIAERLGDPDRAARYQARAAEIKRGAETHLWNGEERYFMTSIKPHKPEPDIAAAWGVYPFGVWPADDPHSGPAVDRLLRDRWNAAAGGVLAMPGTPYESYWMYYTGKLLLGVAGAGKREVEKEMLDALQRAASPQGLIPEQIGRATGNLWGCAPLPTAQASLLIYAYRRTP